MHILRIFSRPFESMYGPNERCHRPKPLISQPLRVQSMVPFTSFMMLKVGIEGD